MGAANPSSTPPDPVHEFDGTGVVGANASDDPRSGAERLFSGADNNIVNVTLPVPVLLADELGDVPEHGDGNPTDHDLAARDRSNRVEDRASADEERHQVPDSPYAETPRSGGVLLQQGKDVSVAESGASHERAPYTGPNRAERTGAVLIVVGLLLTALLLGIVAGRLVPTWGIALIVIIGVLGTPLMSAIVIATVDAFYWRSAPKNDDFEW